ncbi:MAG: type III polyketide synthase [Geminicoccaceae bacterium]
MSAAPARLLGVATALPPHRFSQAEARAAAAAVFADAFPDIDRLLPLYENSGIGFRNSARPLAWHASGHGFAERNRVFLETAETLLSDCALRAIAQAGLAVADIDAVVAVCSTGIATPGLDAIVAERIGLRPDVVRTPIFGLGCGGGVMGVSRAAALARAEPGSRVLLLVVELCTLALRLTDRSKANLVACALFGDGAGAVVLSTEGDGPAVVASGEHRWPNSLDVMGWTIQDDGLGVLFSVRVPEVVRRHMRGATDTFLERAGRRRAAIDGWICHPGGAKVVSGLEEALELGPEATALSRQVLHDCGNMSAASVLFVLERTLARPDWTQGLMLAMGPGFSAGFALLER